MGKIVIWKFSFGKHENPIVCLFIKSISNNNICHLQVEDLALSASIAEFDSDENALASSKFRSVSPELFNIFEISN